nr:DUF4157 domain-containing protein [Haloarcula sp. S1CR25-12]
MCGRVVSARRNLGARILTVGNHIAFNRGEYGPESAEGQQL